MKKIYQKFDSEEFSFKIYDCICKYEGLDYLIKNRKVIAKTIAAVQTAFYLDETGVEL